MPMKKTKALDVITTILSAMEEQPSSREDLLQDLQEMRFTVTPVSGDISSMAWEKGHFLESLWNFGKIDQIVRRNYANMDEQERERLMDFLADYEESVSEKTIEQPSPEIQKELLQLEIVREFSTSSHKKPN